MKNIQAPLIPNSWEIGCFPPTRSEEDRDIYTFLQHYIESFTLGSWSGGVREREREKGHQIRKEEVKLFLFIDDIILYIENHRESTKKLLELICECSIVARYTAEIINKLYFYILVTNNLKMKQRKQFCLASKRINT